MKRIILTVAVLFIILCGIAVAEETTIVASGDCGIDGSNVTWTLDSEGTLTIKGEGEMEDYIFEEYHTAPWYSERESIQAAVIEDGVTKIGSYAFGKCSGLSSIRIPESMTSIGAYAFYGCSSSRKVYTESLESWMSISISDEYAAPLYEKGNLYIDDQLITDLILPDGITHIGDYAFCGCSSLINVTLPESIVSIGGWAFAECVNLSGINLPMGVTSISDRLFSGCINLREIEIPEGVTSIGIGAFCECKISNIDIPEGVTLIGDLAFTSCHNLRRITIPGSVASIGEDAFSRCSKLSSITISEGVSSIGNWAFWSCVSLRNIVIPKSVTSIGGAAFADCYNLESVILLGKDMPSVGTGALPSSVTIYCHEGSEVAEWAMTNGYTIEYLENHTHIPVIDPAVPATHVTTGLTEGSHCEVCGEVLVEQKIVPIVQVEKVVLPAELEVIEAEAFAGGTFACVVLPDGCKAIGAGAFKNCAQLRFIEIPTSVTSIDGTAFAGCSDSLIIVTVSGSEAQRFAQEHEISCVLR